MFLVLQVGAVFEVAGLPSCSVGRCLFSSWQYKLVSFAECRANCGDIDSSELKNP